MVVQVGLGFALYDDLSGIPDVDDEVPDLPVKPPYWMRNNNTQEKQHFGSLDKGVATNAIICSFFVRKQRSKLFISLERQLNYFLLERALHSSL